MLNKPIKQLILSVQAFLIKLIADHTSDNKYRITLKQHDLALLSSLPSLLDFCVPLDNRNNTYAQRKLKTYDNTSQEGYSFSIQEVSATNAYQENTLLIYD